MHIKMYKNLFFNHEKYLQQLTEVRTSLIFLADSSITCAAAFSCITEEHWCHARREGALRNAGREADFTSVKCHFSENIYRRKPNQARVHPSLPPGHSSEIKRLCDVIPGNQQRFFTLLFLLMPFVSVSFCIQRRETEKDEQEKSLGQNTYFEW